MTTKEFKIRKFEHHNIIKHLDPNNLSQVKEEIEKDFVNQQVNTNNIKINSGSELPIRNYKIKSLLIPNGNFTLIREHLIQSYKSLKLAKNFDKINKVFLISYSYNASDSKIYLSSYSAYETLFKTTYNINSKIYEALLDKNSKIKKHIQVFEKQSYINTIFSEENQVIKEINEEITENIEDSEFSFDIHLALLNLILKERKVEIIPIWVNSTNFESISLLLDSFEGYLQDESSLFLMSTNLTYFGRMYNFFGDSKYKSKSFLKDSKNEKEVSEFIRAIDSKVVNGIFNRNISVIEEAENLVYTRQVFLFCYEMFNKLMKDTVHKIEADQLLYSNTRQETSDNEYEINILSFVSIAFVFDSSV